MAEDFRVDAGRLLLIGPAPLIQHRTCVAGQTCAVDGISGVELQPDDAYLLSDDCQQVIPGLPEGGYATAAPNTSLVQWSSTPATAQGGTYKLCWCASTSIQSVCSGTEFGSLVMIGPRPLEQSSTCSSGQACEVWLSGVHLSATNVLVLDTCGVFGLPGWPKTLLTSRANDTDPKWLAGWNEVTAAGGSYRLCWCFGSCDATSSTWMDFGSMHMIGPTPLHQHRTCVTGQVCTIDRIAGTDLGHLAILDTCGATHQIWEHGEHILPLINQSNTSLERLRLSHAGGAYRLCWCSSSITGNNSAAPCSVSSNFRTDVGSMLIIGVAPLHQDRTCITGMQCSFDVEGLWLASGDEVLVLDTCGSGEGRFSASMMARWEMQNNSLNLTDAASVAGAQILPNSILSASGGKYRLCWCQASQHGCVLSSHFQTDFGELSVVGPSPLTQQRTCVAGQSCAFDGIQGQYLSSPSLAVLDTCGLAGAPFIPSLATPDSDMGRFQLDSSADVRVAGGQYRLCWCPRSFMNSTNASDCLAEEHIVTFGSLEIIGPSPLGASFTCISGQSCTIKGLSGAGQYHLTPGDKLLILETCASHGLVPKGLTEAVSAQTSLVFSSGVIFTWPLLPTSPGGTYRMCWCAAAFSCSSMEDFKVDAGELMLVGPSPLKQDRTCVSGRTCVVDDIYLFPDSNASLNESDSMFLVLDTCGSFSLAGGLMTKGTLDATGLVLASHKVSAAGGSYRLCWCGSQCSKSTDFRVDVGEMTILAPSPWQQTCVSGQTCQLQGDAESIRALDACNLGSSTDMVISSGGSIVLTAAGGSYRMCWCAVLPNEPEACVESDDFVVDVGSLLVVGPAPLMQARTCISGLPCHLYDTQGEALSVQDRVLLLETCGQSQTDFAAFLLSPFIEDMNASVPSMALASPSIVTGVGGEYRMCWCAGSFSCLASEQFRVDFGSLFLLAPAAKGRTCVTGQRCLPEGLFEGLGGAIQVLETCGSASPVQGFGYSVWEPSASEGLYITAAGGIYRLCWCGQSSELRQVENLTLELSCTTPQQFVTDVGFLWVAGPAPLAQHRTCVAGQACVIDPFRGLTDGLDAVAVLETCGVDLGLGMFNADLNASRNYTGNETAIRLSFSNAEGSQLDGGNYRLCWCTGEMCAEFQDFRADIGMLQVVGPSPLQQAHTCVSGYRCALEGITGVGLSSPSVTEFRLLQDGASTYDVRLFELHFGPSDSGPWTQALLTAAEASTQWQRFSGWAPADAADAGFWRLRVLQTYGLEPRLREAGKSWDLRSYQTKRNIAGGRRIRFSWRNVATQFVQPRVEQNAEPGGVLGAGASGQGCCLCLWSRLCGRRHHLLGRKAGGQKAGRRLSLLANDRVAYSLGPVQLGLRHLFTLEGRCSP